MVRYAVALVGILLFVPGTLAAAIYTLVSWLKKRRASIKRGLVMCLVSVVGGGLIAATGLIMVLPPPVAAP